MVRRRLSPEKKSPQETLTERLKRSTHNGFKGTLAENKNTNQPIKNTLIVKNKK